MSAYTYCVAPISLCMAHSDGERHCICISSTVATAVTIIFEAKPMATGPHRTAAAPQCSQGPATSISRMATQQQQSVKTTICPPTFHCEPSGALRHRQCTTPHSMAPTINYCSATAAVWSDARQCTTMTPAAGPRKPPPLLSYLLFVGGSKIETGDSETRLPHQQQTACVWVGQVDYNTKKYVLEQ